MPQVEGSDLNIWPHPCFTPISERDSLRVSACRDFAVGQEIAVWPPHPATQADAEVASARINSPEVMELRRTVEYLDVGAADTSPILADIVCKFGQKLDQNET
jgi:hypothetical protein